MDAFFWLIYWGGVMHDMDAKIGFWRRLFWPLELGETLARFAMGRSEVVIRTKEGKP